MLTLFEQNDIDKTLPGYLDFLSIYKFTYNKKQSIHFHFVIDSVALSEGEVHFYIKKTHVIQCSKRSWVYITLWLSGVGVFVSTHATETDIIYGTLLQSQTVGRKGDTQPICPFGK